MFAKAPRDHAVQLGARAAAGPAPASARPGRTCRPASTTTRCCNQSVRRQVADADAHAGAASPATRSSRPTPSRPSSASRSASPATARHHAGRGFPAQLPRHDRHSRSSCIRPSRRTPTSSLLTEAAKPPIREIVGKIEAAVDGRQDRSSSPPACSAPCRAKASRTSSNCSTHGRDSRATISTPASAPATHRRRASTIAPDHPLSRHPLPHQRFLGTGPATWPAARAIRSC